MIKAQYPLARYHMHSRHMAICATPVMHSEKNPARPMFFTVQITVSNFECSV